MVTMEKHKHRFQFVEKYDGYDLKSKKKTGKQFAQFVCLCGDERIAEIKKSSAERKQKAQ